MKKKLMSILLVCTVVFSIFLTACSKEKAEEYTVDELGALIEETQRIFETKTKDLTEDELYSDIDLHLYTDTGIKIYKECCEYTGLPYDTEIIVSGLKKQFFGGIQLYSNDTEYDVGCYFPQEPNSNLGIFVEDGDEVTIKGRITDSPDNLGVIRDIEFISPYYIDTSYEPSDIGGLILGHDSTDEVSAVVQGEVTSVYDNSDGYTSSVTMVGFDGIPLSFEYPTSLCELSVGDKIAIQSDYIFPNSDKTGASVGFGFGTGCVFDLYNFSLEK